MNLMHGRRSTSPALSHDADSVNSASDEPAMPSISRRAAPTEAATNAMDRTMIGIEFERWRDGIIERTPFRLIQVAPAGSPLNSLEVVPREIFLVGGYPAGGKTALAQQLTFDALSQPNQRELRALICNVEMPIGALLDRELARISGVPYSKVRKREFDDGAMHRIKPCLDRLEQVCKRITFLRYPFSASRLVDEVWDNRPDIVVVDYIQRLRSHGGESRMQVSAVMESLREIADGGSAVIAVAALNRTSYVDGSQTSGSFRDSSEIEYGADSAYILQRKLGSSEATLNCVKRRYGMPVELKLKFDGDRQLFKSRDEGSAN